ncbi:hypothetical protein FA95DRAFT_1551703 [Auriscalpium vulgare]|uniref:Uncharacterized protein n=1 Tax=Auriscalpium vulgare TaxID=40419 RepID=A0ACB8SCI8_9AGAM|nr:hypothetical protein FA95DRAFT_1551703 [Auriscalpium vulgare]
MTTSGRKSEGAASRLRAKAPFRGDFERGRRTGVPVEYVDHNSDEFEPFQQILSQADTRTPPHAKKGARNQKRKKSVAVYEDDENGEMSMELDQSPVGGQTSASMYFHNARQPAKPSSVGRAGSSSRPLPRSSDVDYDQVPSPRPRYSVADRSRRSSVFGVASAGPSHLSQSMVAQDEDDGYELPFDDGGDEGFEEEPIRYSQSSAGRNLSRRASFTQLGRDEDEEGEDVAPEDEVEESMRARSNQSNWKGKGKATEDYQEDDEVEDEIARGMEDVEMQQYPEDEQPEDEVAPPPKRKKTAAEEKKKPRGKSKQAVLQIPDSPQDARGLRRGARVRYAPLEWWRREKVVYGRREGGVSFVPTIKEIVRIPKDAPQPLSKSGKRKRSMPPRSKSKTVEEAMVYNPEEGWDDETDTNGTVVDWYSGQEVARRLVFPARHVKHRPAANNSFFFTKVFGDGEYVASGQLLIPPGGHKPSKMTKDNTYVFYVIEGAVTFKVHNSSYILCTGGMILVPRGNTYYIENIGKRDAKLFFAQARRVSAEEEGPPEVLPAEAAPQPRSSSVGQAPGTARLSSERPIGKRGASAKA